MRRKVVVSFHNFASMTESLVHKIRPRPLIKNYLFGLLRRLTDSHHSYKNRDLYIYIYIYIYIFVPWMPELFSDFQGFDYRKLSEGSGTQGNIYD